MYKNAGTIIESISRNQTEFPNDYIYNSVKEMIQSIQFRDILKERFNYKQFVVVKLYQNAGIQNNKSASQEISLTTRYTTDLNSDDIVYAQYENIRLLKS